jgi:hypothetical protein
MLGRASEISVITIRDNANYDLGEEIERWLKKHPDAEILQIHFTVVYSADEYGGRNNYSEALIIYRIPEEG